ncbi:unnamed protein product [Pocillopora meandrina]|uniref:CHAT domain-containing protein n=1 Tax=Pocillopora meandrina TaxID=46732 RepID=A0AAU9W4H8_9CNID|nr:unnamed protein product [Pocillopora meandrina]
MSDAAEILNSVKIGLNVAIFLLNTDRGLQATALCNECIILLQNLVSGGHLSISDVLFNAYHPISGYTDAERYVTTLLDTFHHAGRLTIILGDKYEAQSRFVEAKQLFQGALTIMKTIGHKRQEAMAHVRLGNVCSSLSEYQKAKEYHEKALAIAIEIGDRSGEGTTCGNLGKIGNRYGEETTYTNLGSVFGSLGEYHKAKEYHEKALAIAIEIGDRSGEGTTCGNLGSVFDSLGEYRKAKEYHEKALAIAIEIGNRYGEGTTYTNLGSVFHSLGECQKAKEYHEEALAIAVEIGDRNGEGTRYGNLGSVFHSLGEYHKAKEHHEKALTIAIEIGDREGEGTTYGNLGNVFHSLGEHQKAREYHEKALAIAIEIGARRGEAVGVSLTIGDGELGAMATVGLAAVFATVNDSQKAKEYCEKALTIRRERGNREFEAQLYLNLGNLSLSFGECGKAADYLQKACSISSQIGNKMIEFQSLLSFTVLKISQSEASEAMDYLLRCIEKYEQIRTLLKGNSGFQMSLLENHGTFPYMLLTNFLCGTGKFQNALYVEELGRARVLAEFMAGKYSTESHISADPPSWFGIENIVKRESNCVFLYISYTDRKVLLWVLKANGDIFFRKTDEVKVETLIAERVCDVEGIFKKSAACFGCTTCFDVLPAANCEDRSPDDKVTTSLHEESQANLRGNETKDNRGSHYLCYEWIVAPVADLLTEPEIIIVPDRFSYRVPFAALRDEPAGKYLSERYRIRIVPSLTTLRLIQECPADYHRQTGALVVGDPTVGKVHYNGRLTDMTPIFFASKEAEMVAQLLGVQPLLGSRATKQAVLQAIPSVSLIHLAAHGNAERGEIALSPQCTTNSTPQEEDYLLTMSDIEGVQVRAKLVVLSCSHSGRGLVKKEGVIGIARAFLASGARSVLVASWALEDKATVKLMKHFYKHLVRGESASESLHQAVQWMRSNGYPKPAQWAPFMLMGDNVTFDFMKKG